MINVAYFIIIKYINIEIGKRKSKITTTLMLWKSARRGGDLCCELVIYYLPMVPTLRWGLLLSNFAKEAEGYMPISRDCFLMMFFPS